MKELSLSDFGLETTEQAGARRGQSGSSIRNLVATGVIPAVVVGSGRTARYLVPIAAVDAVPIRAKGRPAGADPEEKKAAAKPTKNGGRKKSGKKSGNP